MSTNCNDHCISCVSGDKEQKYKKWHVFSGTPILLLDWDSEGDWPSSNQNQVATMKIGQWEVIWCIQLIGLCLLGGVKDGRDTKLVRYSTEVTLLKHASASNKHVCEVRSIAHRSQHMFIAPEKKCLYAYL